MIFYVLTFTILPMSTSVAMFVSEQTVISYVNTLLLTSVPSMSLVQNQVFLAVLQTGVEHAQLTTERQQLQDIRSEIPPVRNLSTVTRKDISMYRITKKQLTFIIAIVSIVSLTMMMQVSAATAEDLDKDSRQALQTLYTSEPVAETLSRTAKAILVFPNIVKAGLVFGGSYGEGELIEGSKVVDYYNSLAGSWGLQIGAQSYGYAVFLMTDDAVNYLKKSKGWELGVGPTVVVVDEGVAKNLSTTSLKDEAYAFIFSQQGLMAGVSIEGTKISRIDI
jgi:lipid-binding SYLF domain-containing protein